MPRFITFVLCLAVLLGGGGWALTGWVLACAVVVLLVGYGVWLLAGAFFSPVKRPGR